MLPADIVRGDFFEPFVQGVCQIVYFPAQGTGEFGVPDGECLVVAPVDGVVEEAVVEDMVELIMPVVLQFCKDFVVHGMDVGFEFSCREKTFGFGEGHVAIARKEFCLHEALSSDTGESDIVAPQRHNHEISPFRFDHISNLNEGISSGVTRASDEVEIIGYVEGEFVFQLDGIGPNIASTGLFLVVVFSRAWPGCIGVAKCVPVNRRIVRSEAVFDNGKRIIVGAKLLENVGGRWRCSHNI